MSVSTQRRVVVSGMGCVSPLGVGCAATLAALQAARDCVTPVTEFDVSRCRSTTAGQVTDLSRAGAINARAGRWSRAAQMLLIATHEALGQGGSFSPEIAVIGTTSGGMPLGEAFYRASERGSYAPRRWVRDYVPQQPALDALRTLGIDAPLRVLSNACATGTNAVGNAFHLVRSGRVRRALCGGYDALCELVFAGFASLQASTGEKCRPFDAGRSGLVLGEGAAVFLLETAEDAEAAGRPILAEIAGYGAANDNHHLTQPNPDGSGPRMSMERALRDAGMVSDGIDYVNAHGTATPFNDACEARAIMDVCPEATVSSTKGQMGHSLGAAGAIEAAFCVLGIRNALAPANLHFRSADDGVALDIVANAPRPMRIRAALSNSLGFGGSNASLVIREVAP